MTNDPGDSPGSSAPEPLSEVPPKWSLVSATIGSIISVLTILTGLVRLADLGKHPSSLIAAVLAFVAGAVVMPPVTRALRAKLALLRPWSAPPIVYIALMFTGTAIGHQDDPAAKGVSPPQQVAPSTPAAPASTAPAASPSEAAASVAPPSLWVYDTSNDKMRGTTTNVAFVESTDHPEFAFPYAGGSTVGLMLRKAGKGEDVMMTVDKGQFICNPLDGAIPVKFDDSPIQQFQCANSSDGNTSRVFLVPAKRFITQVRKARRVIAEPEFFQAGTHQITFMTDGLKW